MQIDKRQVKIYMAMGGFSTKNLATKIGMKPQNLSAILVRGTCRPETAARIAEGLGVTVIDIAKEEN